MLPRIAIAAAAGAVAGGGAGLLVAICQLHAKRLRNAALVRRGEPPYRDCVLIPWHRPCAMIGGLVSAILAVWLPLGCAIICGSLPLPALLLLLWLAAIAHQMLRAAAKS